MPSFDEGWYMLNPEDRPKPELLKYAIDENGRFIPVLERFPSSIQNGKSLSLIDPGLNVTGNLSV